MSQLPNDDLFEATRMTFGEHLEELRVSLFKALGWLAVGTAFGMLLANNVVQMIQRPLVEALETYYNVKALDELNDQYGEDPAQKIKDFVIKKKFIPEEVYVEINELKRLAKEFNASANDDGGGEIEIHSDSPPAPNSQFYLTRIWRKLSAEVTSLNAQEVFMIWLKAAVVTGIVLASPMMFWHIWSFVAAGLYPHERRYIHIFLPFSVLLFILGACMAFFFVFRPVLDFLFGFNLKMGIDPRPRIAEWLGFVLFLPIGFGVSFQLPLVMLFLERIGMFTVASYLSRWRLAILVIFVISMFLTPADPISMLLMAVPLTLLYFIGVGLCQWMPEVNRGLDAPDGSK